MISDTLALNPNAIRDSQNEVIKTLRYDSVRMMPENSTLMTLGMPPTVPTMLLRLDRALIARNLQELKVKADEIDYQWARNIGRATVLASQSIFDEVWNSPEEDEAWRDL